MQNPCENCHEYCWVDFRCGRCNGSGRIVDFTVGLGPHGMVPSYVNIPCVVCGGSGLLRSYCQYY